MLKTHTHRRLIEEKIKKTGVGFVLSDLKEEHYLETLSKYEEFDDNDEELKKLSLKVAEMYFCGGIAYQEFKDLIWDNYPQYKDNYTFNVLLEQNYRKLYYKYLKERANQVQMLRRLILVYKKRNR